MMVWEAHSQKKYRLVFPYTGPVCDFPIYDQLEFFSRPEKWTIQDNQPS